MDNLVPRRLLSIRKCKGCGKTLKNKYNYVPFPKTILKTNEQTSHNGVWFGVDKKCRRCGHYNVAS